MSFRMTVFHAWAYDLCEGVSEDSGAWYMMSRILFHGMTCRIPFRIGIFFIRKLMCVLLCEHDIACALRWGVALVGVILTGHCSPHHGNPFQVQVMYRRLTLIRDCKCKESQTMALRNLFVKKTRFYM